MRPNPNLNSIFEAKRAEAKFEKLQDDLKRTKAELDIVRSDKARLQVDLQESKEHTLGH